MFHVFTESQKKIPTVKIWWTSQRPRPSGLILILILVNVLILILIQPPLPSKLSKTELWPYYHPLLQSGNVSSVSGCSIPEAALKPEQGYSYSSILFQPSSMISQLCSWFSKFQTLGIMVVTDSCVRTKKRTYRLHNCFVTVHSICSYVNRKWNAGKRKNIRASLNFSIYE